MNIHDIELPPLPDWADSTLQGEDRDSLFTWASAAIEADRKRRGEPEALIREAALHLTNWLALGECECEGPGHQCGRTQVERCRDRLLDAAPQPAVSVVPADPPGDNFGSAEHWKEKAQYWANESHKLSQEMLRSAQPTAPAPEPTYANITGLAREYEIQTRDGQVKFARALLTRYGSKA